MKVLDLFSGIGGFSLGLERAGMETVAFCEFDKKAQLVLKKHWPDVPIYDDVRELTYDKLKEDGILADTQRSGGYQGDTRTLAGKKQTKKGRKPKSRRPPSVVRSSCEDGNKKEGGNDKSQGQSVDIICGGFPCQPFSQAGKRQGDQDDRHLWPEYFGLIQEIRPRWVIGENVAGLISMGLDQVLSDLEGEDYSCQTLVIPACAVNAPHRRDRVWIVANTKSTGAGDNQRGIRGLSKRCRSREEGVGQADVAYSNNQRTQRGEEAGDYGTDRAQSNDQLSRGCGDGDGWWAVEPGMGRVANGIPNRMDRLKQLGNAVVPQVVEQIGRAIMEIENDDHSSNE